MEKNKEDVGATAFYLPDSQDPRPHFKAYYGNQSVPHPTNSAAKVNPQAEVMRAVCEGK
jgi:hypothetical protein